MTKIQIEGQKVRWSCSVVDGTFFAKSRIKLHHILSILYFHITGSNYSQILNHHEVSTKTVTDFKFQIRQLLAEHVKIYPQEIGGIDEEGNRIIVEIDETKLGKRKYHRGKRVEGVWVFGGVERTPQRRVFCMSVENRTAQTLMPLIYKYIKPGSIIHSDCWRAYNGIEGEVPPEFESVCPIDPEYTHKTVNHSIGYKADNGTHTNTIEGTWLGLKINVPYRARTKDFVDGYTIEFVWRRQWENRVWEGLMEALRKVRW